MLALPVFCLVAMQTTTCPSGKFEERDECLACEAGKYREDQDETVTCLIRLDPETVIINNGVQYANKPIAPQAVITGAPDYAWGRLGVPECPLNYHPIYTASACQQATNALKDVTPDSPELSFLEAASGAWSSSTVTYTPLFTKYAGKACSGRNELPAQTNIDVDAAKAWCNNEPTCISFEHNRN